MPDGVEALLRQLIAGQAEQGARLDGLNEWVGTVAEDARAARDVGNHLVAKLEEQNIGVRMTELKNELNGKVDALRADVVLANQSLRKDVQDLERRVEVLEAARQQVVGVASFFSWLSRVAPWLLAGAAAFAAGLGLKDKLP